MFKNLTPEQKWDLYKTLELSNQQLLKEYEKYSNSNSIQNKKISLIEDWIFNKKLIMQQMESNDLLIKELYISCMTNNERNQSRLN